MPRTQVPKGIYSRSTLVETVRSNEVVHTSAPTSERTSSGVVTPSGGGSL